MAMAELYEIAEVELIYRKQSTAYDNYIITEDTAANEILRKAWDETKIDMVEEFKILLLRQNNSVIGVSHIARGGISSCIADPRVIFMTALKANACQIILAHNHPSGNLKPSQADLDLTDKLVEGGRLLDIKVLDHLIMTSNGYTSMFHGGYMLR
ncbi:MAG: JAB domain-containing protein [Bacteroidetes bacterium]|nr:JAB domain-containing protein [Bacteroidota bacterium]